MVHILWGEDQFSMEEALQEDKNSAGDASMLAINTHVLDGREADIE